MEYVNAINAVTLENSNNKIDLIWFDDNINSNYENKFYLETINPILNSSAIYNNLEEGFNKYYSNSFNLIFTIVSGKLWGRYLQFFMENINKIINIPFVVIFTSQRFKDVLLQKKPDEQHILSYDTINKINDPFYNPGGVISSYDELVRKIQLFKVGSEYKIKIREIEKRNFEGILTFEYLHNEEDLLAPALYKEIITKEPIQEEEIKKLIDYFLSYNNQHINNLILNLKNFENIPFEILCKYSARIYTFETEFYKNINYDLMKSKMNDNYKTYIKLLYNGIENKSFSSFTGELLYRGSRINKSEVIKIIDYKNKGRLNNIVVFSKAFLSFSEKESEAMKYLGKSDNYFLGILFLLENFNKNNQESNADIHKFSAFQTEKEILFFPGSSFIIKDIIFTNNNYVKIILNYNGKFKEKYNVIYRDKNRLNNLIIKNTITKLIAGKEMEFLKNGEYLIIEKNIKMYENNSFIKEVMKAKDLKNNEMVYIKQIWDKDNSSYDEKYYAQLTYLLAKMKNSNCVCTLKDSFSIKNSFYIVVDIYDDYLSNYLKKIKPKGLPPNLIKKIMSQLKKSFKGLANEIGERSINPSNIFIKYTNKKKNNFNAYLSENGIYEFENNFFTYYYYHPDIIKNKIRFSRKLTNIDIKIKMKYELFNIGMTLYELYFNIIPFYKESDYQLYQDIVLKKKGIIELKYDPLDYPLLEDLKEKRKKRIEMFGKPMKQPPLLEALTERNRKGSEMFEKPIRQDRLFHSNFELEQNKNEDLKEALILTVNERRNLWIKNLSHPHELSEKKQFIFDNLLYDLIYKLIKYESKENITNYDDFFAHPFFSQYQY